MSEWLKEPDLQSGRPSGLAGSNPARAATICIVPHGWVAVNGQVEPTIRVASGKGMG